MTRRFFAAKPADNVPGRSVSMALRLARAETAPTTGGACDASLGARVISNRVFNGQVDETDDVELFGTSDLSPYVLVIANGVLCADAAWSVTLDYTHAHSWSLDTIQTDVATGVTFIYFDMTDAENYLDESTEVTLTITAGATVTSKVVTLLSAVSPPPMP